MENQVLDNLDKNILLELGMDSRKPFREIARNQGVSIGTIHNRLKKMKEAKVIKGFTTKTSRKALGYDFTAIYLIKITGLQKRETIIRLEALEEVSVMFQISGAYNYVLITRFKTLEDYRDFSKKINTMSNVTHENYLVLDEIKDDYFPMI